jgi:hypothetical protein
MFLVDVDSAFLLFKYAQLFKAFASLLSFLKLSFSFAIFAVLVEN